MHKTYFIVAIEPMVGNQREAVIRGNLNSDFYECLLIEKEGSFDVMPKSNTADKLMLSYFDKKKPLDCLFVGDSIQQHFVDYLGKKLQMRGFRRAAGELIYEMQVEVEQPPYSKNTIYRKLHWCPFTCSYHFCGRVDRYSFSLQDYLKCQSH